MFLRILKRDLKRKRVMNVILLIFIIMCSMFAAASVSSISAVTGGIDSYFDKAGVPDLLVRVPYSSGLEEEIRALPEVNSVRTEHHLTVLDSGCFRLNGEKMDNFTNSALLINSDERAITYFDESNSEVGALAKGEFYATSVFSEESDIKEGDRVILKMGDTELSLTYKGRFKGAIHGKNSSDHPVVMLSREDYDICERDKAFYGWAENCICIETDDPDSIKERYSGMLNVYVNDRDSYKEIYLYDMITAYVMMIISIVLMFAGFVMLRFTIGFTVSEEFREIGVMKAVGISSGRIRRLYLVKYLAIALIGAVIGYFCSLPLSRAMLDSMSQSMVFDTSSNFSLGLISTGAVILMIMLFCWLCTGRVKKLSPIDAIRSGQTGERFGRRSVMQLGHSRLPASGFMALNDVLSAPKQFIIMTFIFTLCLLLMTCMSNFSETLKSSSIIGLFGIPDCDITIGDVTSLEDVFAGKGMQATVDKYDRLLKDSGINGKVSLSVGGNYEAVHGSSKEAVMFLVTKGEPDSAFIMDEGKAPMKEDEVAMTPKAMKALNAEIGDRINVTMGGRERELIITGAFSSFIGSGTTARLCSSCEIDPESISNSFGLQVRLEGSRSREAVNEAVEKLKKLLDCEKVYLNEEIVDRMTGLSGTMRSMKQMMMILTVIVTALIAVLTERSFISKEKSEIALMKAIGIRSRSIAVRHVLRFVIVAAAASVISSAVLMPLGSGLLLWVFSMVGDVKSVTSDLNAAEVFGFCPALLICTSAVFPALTALYMKRIKASDTASIE